MVWNVGSSLCLRCLGYTSVDNVEINLTRSDNLTLWPRSPTTGQSQSQIFKS